MPRLGFVTTWRTEDEIANSCFNIKKRMEVCSLKQLIKQIDENILNISELSTKLIKINTVTENIGYSSDDVAKSRKRTRRRKTLT